jgi:hypothetical protein
MPLGTQHFAMQAVAFEIADDLAVEVDLVQVTAAVVQPFDPAAIGQLALDQVAEFIVVVPEAVGDAVVDEQLADGNVGETQGLRVALPVGEGGLRACF